MPGRRTAWGACCWVVGSLALVASLSVVPWAQTSYTLANGIEEGVDLGIGDVSDVYDRAASDGSGSPAGAQAYVDWGAYVVAAMAMTAAALAWRRPSASASVGLITAAALVHAGAATYVASDLPEDPAAGGAVLLAGLVALGMAAVLLADDPRAAGETTERAPTEMLRS